MTLSYSENEGTLLWHPEGAVGTMPDWSLNCKVTWLGPKVIFLSSFGRVGQYKVRTALRELLDWLEEREISAILARRAQRNSQWLRILPGSVALDGPLVGLFLIDVKALLDRYAEPGSSEFASL